jgi:hypothetical protein
MDNGKKQNLSLRYTQNGPEETHSAFHRLTRS